MDKVHIVITGRRNTGKSSLVNRILGQERSVVSDIAGTTTDPVRKSFELPGTASLVLVDTAGTDDEGELGRLRVDKTYEAIRQADAAILVISGNRWGSSEEKLVEEFQKLGQDFLIVHNKNDLEPADEELVERIAEKYRTDILPFSTLDGDTGILLDRIGQLVHRPERHSLLEGIVRPGQTVMLVTPIDSEAPTGRLILPQVQMLRDILDNRCTAIVLQPDEIPGFMDTGRLTPDLVITDSQVFGKVAVLIPPAVPLTGFSIVLAHHKGNFNAYLKGVRQLDHLEDNDRILMLESCSHHVSCEDIGRVKLPALIRRFSGKKLEFDFVNGLDKIKRPFSDYALIVQCGGCMVTSRQLHNRLQPAVEAGIPVCNYGMCIAYIQGIFERAVRPFCTD